MKTVFGVLQRILPPLWCGMLVAIAIEAPLKFQAPGITRELGLGIGKLVFTALNRIECATAILLAQTFLFIPLLVARIDLITAGQTPPASPAHFVYIALEILKIVFLLILSVLLNLKK